MSQCSVPSWPDCLGMLPTGSLQWGLTAKGRQRCIRKPTCEPQAQCASSAHVLMLGGPSPVHLRSCKSFDCVKSKETDVKPKHEKREKRPAVRPQHGRDTGGRLGRLLMHTMTLCVLSGLLKSMKMEETILSTF